ncbi:MAG TPA: D-threitol dehydrogenase [Pseudogracilibacillus sp.]|nr:D-threitol dehydrogenase [Pseudogracilibacillus sp.]
MDNQMFDKNFDLTNKIAVITGGASGIGKAIAELYIAKKAKVVILDIHEDVDKIAKNIHPKYALGIRCDITNKNSINEAITTTINTFSKIDILVNSAGVALLDDAENLSEDYWNKTMELNLTASFNMCQAVGNIMIKQQTGGNIINLASQAAIIALDNHVAYSASKAAIISITKSLAFEWAQFNIRVNSISPTVVLTELGKKAWAGEVGEKAKEEIPLKRFGYPEEVAAIAVFLASDATGLITGENIVMDGGNTIK